MATIHFFGKPNCINNNKQKQLLTASGHILVEYDITRCDFTDKILRTFFGAKPVVEWFNTTAPAIKKGVVDPATIGADAALAAMLADRLLIRRPLMQVGDWRLCGFDREEVERAIALTALPGEEATFSKLMNEDIVTCPNLTKTSCEERGVSNE